VIFEVLYVKKYNYFYLTLIIHVYLCREERTEFIRYKYVDKRFVGGPADQESLLRRVELAIDSDDLLLLVRTWAQGALLGQPLPSSVSVS